MNLILLIKPKPTMLLISPVNNLTIVYLFIYVLSKFNLTIQLAMTSALIIELIDTYKILHAYSLGVFCVIAVYYISDLIFLTSYLIKCLMYVKKPTLNEYDYSLMLITSMYYVCMVFILI